jgi:hypothetical protein
VRWIALVTGLLVVVAGCSDGASRGPDGSGAAETSSTALPVIESRDDEVARLAAARARWEAAGIDSYAWSFTRICFCPPLTAEVQVEGGEAVSEDIDVDFGDAGELDFTTMEELFDFIADEIRQSDEVTVDYDSDTGQVRSFDADRITRAVDDELGYQVQSLVPADQRRPDLGDVELTESFPCGHGFQASNTGQTVGLFLAMEQPSGRPARTIELPDPQWRAIVVRGEDLFANWCDDLIVSGEPTPERTATLPLIAGTVTFDGPVPARNEFGARATVRLTGLVAREPDGSEVELQDAVVVNENWGGGAG